MLGVPYISFPVHTGVKRGFQIGTRFPIEIYLNYSRSNMYLFNRTIETTGEMAKIIPILHDLKKAVLAAGVDATVWLGGAGYKMGTVIFTTPYENLADRAEANVKLGASEAVMEANQKLISYTRGVELDTIIQYLKGGTLAAAVPVGAVVSLIQSQLAQGADWMKTLEWSMAMAELNEKISGVTANLGFVTFGQLGGLVQFSGFANAAAAEAAREAQMASAEWMPLFLKGGEFALAGSVISRQMTKLA